MYSFMEHTPHATLGEHGMVKKRRFIRNNPALQRNSLLDQFKMWTGKVCVTCRAEDVSVPMDIAYRVMIETRVKGLG